jgi:hypothetical protein
MIHGTTKHPYGTVQQFEPFSRGEIISVKTANEY